MKKLNHIFIILIIIGLYSCGMGTLPKNKESYAGTWVSNNVMLEITKEGKVNYKKEEGGTKTSINAPIQQFVGNNFEVGILGINTTFVVNQIPHQDAGAWKMTVDNVELTKVDL